MANARPRLQAATGMLDHAGRLLVSVVVLGALLLILGLVTRVHVFFLDSVAARRAPLIAPSLPAPERTPSRVQPPWPRFPRSTSSEVQRTVINGVEVLTEEWESLAAAGEILAYYREQMAARGWHNVTEDTFGLRPELRDHDAGLDGLQNARYLETYRDVMESKLVMSRGNWSMHVMVDPAKKTIGGVAVRIYAAATPSVADHSGGVMSAFLGGTQPAAASRSLDAVQHSGGQRYHTTVVVKPRKPAQEFQAALLARRAEGWRPVASAPQPSAQAGHFVWLVRGREYAVLSARLSPAGDGTVVSFTEVSPE